LNPFFMVMIAAIAVLIWAVGSFFFWRIDRKVRSERAAQGVSPALRLADRWIAEAQGRLEGFIEACEAPLSAAQNDLLELRLEASRLPQGVKNLSDVRESLALPLSPRGPGRDLAGIVGTYLEGESFGSDGPSLVKLRTPLGEMPVLEAASAGPTEDLMKALLSKMNQLDAGSAGGFIFFREEAPYLECLGNPEWMEGLRARRVHPLDLRGLTALLSSLRLSKDVETLISVFDEGVKSTKAILGKSERMGEALSSLNARALKVRAVLEGSLPDDLRHGREPPRRQDAKNGQENGA